MGIVSTIEFYNDNQEAKDFLRFAEYTNNSIFLTGKAGTGKSYLLKKFTDSSSKNYIILAPTGVAALNVEGQTIHSFFQLPINPLLPNDNNIKILFTQSELIRKLDTIIIDEISMVRCDIMNAIDISLRRNLANNLPFGGKQIIIVGDLFQLPPVVDSADIRQILRSNYGSMQFYGAKIFDDGFDFDFIELKKVYRQTQQNFIKLLDNIRTNKLASDDLLLLNSRISRPDTAVNEGAIILLTNNKEVGAINDAELNKLSGNTKTFKANVTGTFTSTKKHPTAETLNLKFGARVMIIRNDREKNWVNGDIGIVTRLNYDSVVVKLDRDEQEYLITTNKWEDYSYKWDQNKNQIEKEVTGTFEQLPLKLAWAITIHKSQGQTFDKVVLDIGRGAFATGQVYVALTRCRTFEGLILINGLGHMDIMVNEELTRFIKKIKEKNMERNKFEEIIKGLEQKLKKVETVIQSQREKIEELKSENVNISNKLTNLTKKNLNSKNFIKGLVVAVIVLIIIIIIMST